MDLSRVEEFFRFLETENVIKFLQGMNAEQLVYNPWFLGIMGTLAVVALLMRWRVLLATIVALTGCTWLISYTLEKGTSVAGGGSSDTMLVFVGVGAGLVFMVIYLLFIRSE